MSPRKPFDRYMVTTNAASRPKVKRLKRAGKEVRWAWFHGVLPIAAEADIRGCFTVGALAADEHDVAEVADVTIAEARKAIETARSLGMLYLDDDLGVERVHDWDEVNPSPRKSPSDAPEATRDRKRKERKSRPMSRDVTTHVTSESRTSHEDEVEGRKKEDPPNPPEGDNVVTFRRRRVSTDQLALAEALLVELNAQAGTSYGAFTGQGKPSDALQRILGAVVDHPNLDLAEGKRIITWRLQHVFWDGAATTGVVFGPNVFEGNRASAMMTTGNGGGQYTDEQMAKFL